jgi:hypothetical protein
VSRRHHGGRPHRPGGHLRPAEPARGPSLAPSDRAGFAAPAGSVHDPVAERPVQIAEPAPPDLATHEHEHNGVDRGVPGGHNGAAHGGHGPGWTNGGPNGGPIGGPPHAGPDGDGAAACTAPQLRRFIKSRPYVPMHELRRRFGINGGEDDVTPVDLGSGRVFVGLPQREGALLGELLRGGEIGYELSLDPRSPVVVGLYPMRPVART